MNSNKLAMTVEEAAEYTGWRSRAMSFRLTGSKR